MICSNTWGTRETTTGPQFPKSAKISGMHLPFIKAPCSAATLRVVSTQLTWLLANMCGLPICPSQLAKTMVTWRLLREVAFWNTTLLFYGLFKDNIIWVFDIIWYMILLLFGIFSKCPKQTRRKNYKLIHATATFLRIFVFFFGLLACFAQDLPWCMKELFSQQVIIAGLLQWGRLTMWSQPFGEKNGKMWRHREATERFERFKIVSW